MSAWRLEWLRATRSRRGFVLAAVYLFFVLAGPLMAKYMTQVAKYASTELTIIAGPRHTLSTVGITFGVLFLTLPIAGLMPGVGSWLPSRLWNAPAALLTGASLDGYLRPTVVAVLATTGLLALAAGRTHRRDL